LNAGIAAKFKERIAMPIDFDFTIKSVAFDEDYHPSNNTRATTNFANLARGESRRENLRRALKMIDNRFNALACWDNPQSDRYHVAIEIISVEMNIHAAGASDSFPIIEMLQTKIFDRSTEQWIDGIIGNNFSSYVRDYDFSVVLPDYNRDRLKFGQPENFGELHGKLFQNFLNSKAYRAQFKKQPIICLSASSSKTYYRTDNHHPILGVEYRQDALSSTDDYFKKMGLDVRYFMPTNSTAPLAFYFSGDLLADYSNLELISTISTMESFQRIYRPEIYNANAAAGSIFQPSLNHADFSHTQIVYDREERSRLAIEQGKFTEANFIKPYKAILDDWSKSYAA
jgi:hypothetical protein